MPERPSGRLYTSLLVRNLIRTSKNELLQKIWKGVDAYNVQVEAAAPLDRVRMLSDILINCANYLTSKTPKFVEGEGSSRFLAILELAEQVGRELEMMGLKSVHFPGLSEMVAGAGARSAGGDAKFFKDKMVFLELVDPQRRNGSYLGDLFVKWIDKCGDSKYWSTRESFWEFIGTDMTATTKDIDYFRGDKMQKCRLTPVGGELHDFHDQIYSSVSLGNGHFGEEASMGDGWAMFVVSQDDQIFVESQQPGVVHHTSMLSGAPVRAAGEIVIWYGQIIALTAESGHYMPPPENIVGFVQRCAWVPGHAVARPEISGDRPTRWYSVADLRRWGDGYREYTSPISGPEVLAAVEKTGASTTRLGELLTARSSSPPQQEAPPNYIGGPV